MPPSTSRCYADYRRLKVIRLPRFRDVNIRVVLVVASVFLVIFQSGPLNGTVAALILTLLLQVGLIGYLVADTLGWSIASHPISRFTWIIACGFSTTICLGAICRFFLVSIPIYLLILHLVMLVLVLRGKPNLASTWQFTRRSIPLMLMVLVSCLIVLVFGYVESRFRFIGFGDQTLFIASADWLANDLDQPGVRNRQLLQDSERRNDIDGWTYTNAAWIYTSGVPADQLLWHDLTPLLVWMVPLIFFSLTYALTGREEPAAWTTASLTLFGLLTFDPNWFPMQDASYAQFALFYMRTLRVTSTALFLPLALFVTISFLRKPERKLWLLLFLVLGSLVSTHPRQVVIFLIASAALVFLQWNAVSRPRINYRVVLLVGFVVSIVALLLLSFVADRLVSAPIAQASTCVYQPGERVQTPALWGSAVRIIELPLVGKTYIVEPDIVLYHPLVVAAVLIGLAAGLRFRKSLAAQFLFGTTCCALSLGIVLPPVCKMLSNIIGINLRLGDVCSLDSFPVGNLIFNLACCAIFLIPVPIALGVAIDFLLRKTQAVIKRPNAVGFVTMSTLMLTVAFSPVYGSALAQVQSYTDRVSSLQVQSSEEALLALLRENIPKDRTSIVIAPEMIANIVIESIPHTFVASRSSFAKMNAHFYGDDAMPFLDNTDISFLKAAKADFIVMQFNDSHLLQLLFAAQNFEHIGSVKGYDLFRVIAIPQVGELDHIFETMNAQYSKENRSRWVEEGLGKPIETDVAVWQSIIQSLQTHHQDDVAVKYGLAIAYSMISKNEQALPLWQALFAAYPSLVNQLTYVLQSNSEQYLTMLISALYSEQGNVALLAAVTLLDERFFYLLSNEQALQITNVTNQNLIAWNMLMRSTPRHLWQKWIELVMSRGLWSTASDWIDKIQKTELRTTELAMQGLVTLATGDIQKALAILQPATDPYWLAVRKRLHPDRWEENVAAQIYYLLTGDLAVREGRSIDAEKSYQQAVTAGSSWAGRYWLAKVKADEITLAALDAEWGKKYNLPFPQMSPLLSIATTHSIYVTDPEIERGNDEQTFTFWATYGYAFEQHFPVREWSIMVTNSDATVVLGKAAQPSILIAGALMRFPIIVHTEQTTELTQARLFINPRYDNAVIMSPLNIPFVLQRPTSALLPSSKIVPDQKFGEHITLSDFEVKVEQTQIKLTLYWRTDTPLNTNYQVFVHILDSQGKIAVQRDTAPLGGLYPTSQWRTNTIIRDSVTVLMDTALASGSYTVQMGLYNLATGERLPVHIPNGSVDTSILMTTFTREATTK